MRSPRILFIYNDNASFINFDLNLLKEHYSVDSLFLENIKKINFTSIWSQVNSHDLVFGWFASWHTFLPILISNILKKPSVLVIGGYDLANLPEIGYGHQRGGIRKIISRMTMNMADILITNSVYSQLEAERNANIDRDRVHVVYHGLTDPYQKICANARDKIILSVGNVNWSNLSRKGHEAFVRSAKHLPDVSFFLIGGWKDDSINYLRKISPSNVTFSGRVSPQILLEYYYRASVYVQASMHEGFGLSVAEAMLAGCIPVVSKVGSLPEVVAHHGLYLENRDEEHIASQIGKALNVTQSEREQVRLFIKETFPVWKRAERLYHFINKAFYESK